MIEWINLIIMIISMVVTLITYSVSVQPAKFEVKIGDLAYKICTRLRTVSGIFMIIAGINFFIYPLYPLNIPILNIFPWSYWISFLISLIILIPGISVIIIAYKFAGKETASPQKQGNLFQGIYLKIRHPQYLGEAPMWLGFAFLLNSPFLAFISIGWLGIFLIWAYIEEYDLELRYGASYLEYKSKTGMFFPRKTKI